MLNHSQHDRVARKCAAALSAVIDALPQLLADADPETAALIAADLVKACLVGPAPIEDAGAALAEVMRRCREDTAAEVEHQPTEFGNWQPSTPPAPDPQMEDES